MRLGALLTTILLSASAFATECESRLKFDLADLVERAVLKGVLDRPEAEKLARSEHAYDPLEFTIGTPENTAFKTIFAMYAKLPDERWASECAKVRERILKVDAMMAVQAAAERATRDVIRPQLVMSREGRGFLVSDEGEVFYSVVENGSVCVREIFSNRLVWCSAEKNLRSFSTHMRLNPKSGVPEFRFSYQWDLPALGKWGANWRMSKTYVVDLLSGKASVRYGMLSLRMGDTKGHQWQAAGLKPPLTYVVNYTQDLWGGTEVINVYLSADFMRTNFSVNMRKRTVETSEAFLTSGGDFLLASDVRDQGKRWIEVYQRHDDYGHLKQKFEIPDLETKLSFFENEGEIYLVVDQRKGMTQVYQPLKHPLPLYQGDLNVQRDAYFRLVHAKNGRVYLVARSFDGQSINVFSPFARTR